VLVTARRFRDLGAATGEELGAVGEVDTTPRSPHGVARLFLAHGSADAAGDDTAPAGTADGPPVPFAPAAAGIDR
jgi:hypothetical protein